MKKYFFVSLLIAPIFFASNVSQNFACWVASPSDLIADVNSYNYFVKDYNRSEAVFLGKVIAKDKYRVRFEISKIWKGNLSKNFVMSTDALPLDKSDVVRISSCDYSFAPGESYLVYAVKRFFPDETENEFTKRYGKIPPEYKVLLWASESSRTRVLKDAAPGIKNPDKLLKKEKFKFESSGVKSRSIFKLADNRRASF